MATVIVQAPELPSVNINAWLDFFVEHSRWPRIGDDPAPWKYPGWLMQYRMAAERRTDVAPRWSYWGRTMDAGKLLDEPIPQLEFAMGQGGDRSEGYKQVDKWANIVETRFSRSPLNDLLDYLLWGLGMSNQDPELPEDISEKLYRAINLEPFLLKPYDYLGEWIAGHKGNWNPHAFFPTPHSVCEMMTQINFTGIPYEESRGQSVCDPALGSARMLLHASNYSLCLYGCDIDLVMVKVSKINGALYVPWLVRPFPSEFFKWSIPMELEFGNSSVIRRL